MLRGSLARTTAIRCCSTGALCTPQRTMADKMIVGACASFLTSASVLGVFHLIVTPVSAGIAAATISAATTTGALCVVDGGKEGSGSSFGVIAGLLLGAMGGHYAKSSSEPWR
ncbi:hypothetical protein ADEAN_000577800 [Angomonas deanei]|uniref:Uncharacterized protein n=1 Tax=Angomonas deanei TaxID=59799 RepID=A0A7G2CEJ1_9TRYP|nr:hypothetical protein ADEAN_000577800 [Angomonas deanei]